VDHLPEKMIEAFSFAASREGKRSGAVLPCNFHSFQRVAIVQLTSNYYFLRLRSKTLYLLFSQSNTKNSKDQPGVWHGAC